jgi:hypothetical protein
MELYTITNNGKLTPTPTVAILIDENDQKIIIGYDFPLMLDSIVNNINPSNNNIILTYKSQSISRYRFIDEPAILPTPSNTPSISVSSSVGSSVSPTPTSSVTMTPTSSISRSPSITRTPSSSISVTPSVTSTNSATPSNTPSITPSVSTTISSTPSNSPTPSISQTPTISITPSITPSPSPSPKVYYGFTTEWTVSGDETARTIAMPFTDYGTYNGIINWGDGNYSGITSYDDANNTHTYASNGTYYVEISGSTPGWSFFTHPDHKTKLTDIVFWGNSSTFDGFSNLYGGFYNTNIKSTGIGKILAKPDLTSSDFIFGNCPSLSSITAGVIDNLTGVTSLSQFVINCPITVIPQDIFKYNISVTNFSYVFAETEIKYIPDDLFRYNTLATNFTSAFQSCIQLTGITDSNLFSWGGDTIYTDFCFKNCGSLEIIPDELFNQTNSINYFETFRDCTKLQINPWTFYASGETSTRFFNLNANFTRTFYRDAFNGIQGTAPDLWNCDFGSGTENKTNTFGGTGNDGTSISNYGDIPNDWK